MPGLKAKRSPAPPPPPRWSTSPARPRNHLYARIGSPAGRKQRRRERIATPFSRENGPRVRLRRSSDLSDVVLYAFPGERGRSRTRGGTPTPLLVWRPRGQGQPRKRTSSLPGDSKSDPWWLSRTSVRPTPRSRSFSRSNMPVVALAAARRRGRTGPNVVWETHRVTLHKAPTFGFGIAVSGGRDSPHFANGDPSVAISDVLKAGPAEGKLQINDRIVTVNGTSLENVDHATAINVLRDCGNTVSLVVRRRILLPALQTENPSPPFKITLNKKNKKDDFGIVLGCRLYIREISPDSLAAAEATLREGDTVLKINNTPVENISVVEARKLLEKSKERLQLIVRKERSEDRAASITGTTGADAGASGGAAAAGAIGFDADLLPARVRDKDDVNLYRPSVRSEDELYMKDATLTPGAMGGGLAVPAGAYPNSENTRYDGHYVLDNDLPPRPGRDGDGGLPYGAGDSRDMPASRHNNGYLGDADHSGFYPPRMAPPANSGLGYAADDDDVFSRGPPTNNNISIHDLEPRQVSFPKDKQTGLGLRLAGGNATGIFIASVQPGSAGEREGLVEGDNILMANEREISGLTREEAVSYLTSLTGQVSMLVQYRKEDYDSIMASHEAGDSFYIRAHFSHTGSDQATEHSFQTGDVFHVKDTHFRGGGAWLALRVSEDLTEIRKGTIPNSKTAEILKAQQKGDSEDKDTNFPQRGRGSLFKRKSSRRSKSLGKDHWDEVVFAGLSSKFPAYERVVFTEPGFVRPVVIYGAIADIARERLLSEYPDRFECPQVEKSGSGEKKEKSAIIRLGAIRDAIAQRKHCLLDVTPSNVDRLNYAQYNPIVVFLRAENKQCVKDVRGRWKTGGGARNPRKLLEHSEKLEREYAHLFTGTLKHMGTDAWFPKLCEMIDSQQRQPIWMSEVKPIEDISDDFMFPMSTRLSYAAAAGGGGGADSDMEQSRRDLSPGHGSSLGQGPKPGGRMVRSSSDPSINTQDNVPGIPPYPSPPTYKNQRIPSDSRYSISEVSQRSHRDDYQMHPEDRYYPSYYTDHQLQASRANIDPYATLTPSERLRPRLPPGHFDSGFNEFGPPRERMDLHTGSGGGKVGMGGDAGSQPGISDIPNGTQNHGLPGQPSEQRGQADASSHSSDSYSKYALASPLNKHDDTKLREKFASSLKTGGPGGSLGAHDPYRFTRSTANPVASSSGPVDRAKLSDLQARYRKQDGAPGSNKNLQKPTGSPAKKKEPPPVPAKTFSLRQRGINLDSDEMKMRNYENSNRAYNYTDVNFASGSSHTPPLPPPPATSVYPGDAPYEYMSVRQAQNALANNVISNSSGNILNSGSPSASSQQRYLQQSGRATSFDSAFPQGPPPPVPPPPDFPDFQHHPHQNQHQHHQPQQHYHHHQLQHHQPPHSAYANEIYMDQADMARARQGNSYNGQSYPDTYTGHGSRRVEESPFKTGGMERTSYHNRTDDEQLLELQRSRHRAKSESRLADMTRHPDPDWEGQADSYPSPAPDRRDMHRQSSSSSSIPHASSSSSNYHYTSSRNIPSTQHDSGDIPGRGGERRPTRSNRHKLESGNSRSSGNISTQHQQHRHHQHDDKQQQQQASPNSAFSSYKSQPQRQQQHPYVAYQPQPAPPPLPLSPEQLKNKGRTAEKRRERTPPQRSHSVGSALRTPVKISPKRVPAPAPPPGLSMPPAGDRAFIPPLTIWYDQPLEDDTKPHGRSNTTTTDGRVIKGIMKEPGAITPPGCAGTPVKKVHKAKARKAKRKTAEVGNPPPVVLTKNVSSRCLLSGAVAVSGDLLQVGKLDAATSTSGLAEITEVAQKDIAPNGLVNVPSAKVNTVSTSVDIHVLDPAGASDAINSVPPSNAQASTSTQTTDDLDAVPKAGVPTTVSGTETQTEPLEKDSNFADSLQPNSTTSQPDEGFVGEEPTELCVAASSASVMGIPDSAPSYTSPSKRSDTSTQSASLGIKENKRPSSPEVPPPPPSPPDASPSSHHRNLPLPSPPPSPPPPIVPPKRRRERKILTSSELDRQPFEKPRESSPLGEIKNQHIYQTPGEVAGGSSVGDQHTYQAPREINGGPKREGQPPPPLPVAQEYTPKNARSQPEHMEQPPAPYQLFRTHPPSHEKWRPASRHAEHMEQPPAPYQLFRTHSPSHEKWLPASRHAKRKPLKITSFPAHIPHQFLDKSESVVTSASPKRQRMQSEGIGPHVQPSQTKDITSRSSSELANKPGGDDDISENHTVIATAKGFFTSAGGLLDSPETGVSIWIPEGAIRENHTQEIYFKVCRDNSLLPPLDAEKGETLLSPLVMCGPHGTEFLRPVELRLPHCASANPDNWSFALKSSDSPSGQTTEWQNMSLAGSDTKGRVDSNSVSILVDHF